MTTTLNHTIGTGIALSILLRHAAIARVRSRRQVGSCRKSLHRPFLHCTRCDNPSESFRPCVANRHFQTGVIKQLGETGVAMATLVSPSQVLERTDPRIYKLAKAIAVHTFITVMWRKGKHHRPVAFGIVGVIWFFVILFVGIGVGVNRNKPLSDQYESPTPVSSTATPATWSSLTCLTTV